MAEEEVSSIIREKLMPGEVVIGQTRTNISDLVATDKRILRFSSNSYEAIEYSNISGIRYGSFTGRKVTSRILVVIFTLLLIVVTIAMWVAHFDETVRNVPLNTAVIISIVCGVFALLSLTLVFAYDYGYYQVESDKISKDMERYWRVMCPMFAAKKTKEFFQSVSRQSGIPIAKG